MFLASWSRSRLNKKSGAGVALKKRELEPPKICGISCTGSYEKNVPLLLLFRLKTQLFYLFYISCRFTLVVFLGKKYFAIVKSRRRKEPHVFGSLEPQPEPLEKKTGAGADWEKRMSQNSGRLEKKSGDGSAKNYPRPKPEGQTHIRTNGRTLLYNKI